MKAGLEGLQRGVGSRHDADDQIDQLRIAIDPENGIIVQCQQCASAVVITRLGFGSSACTLSNAIFRPAAP